MPALPVTDSKISLFCHVLIVSIVMHPDSRLSVRKAENVDEPKSTFLTSAIYIIESKHKSVLT